MSRKRSRARIGAKLRKARERCGLSLRQIADSTKISVPVLEGLERDDITYLPAGVLGRGYIRSFASAVKLDPEIAVAEFVAQFPQSSVTDGYPPTERAELDTTESRSSGHSTKIRLDDSGKFVRVASVGVVAVLVAGVVVFAAPKGWPPWTAFHNWATSASGNLATGSVSSARVAVLDARPIQPVRPSAAPSLPRARSLQLKASAKADTTAVATSSPSTAMAAAPPVASKETPSTVSNQPSASAEPIRLAVSVKTPSWVIAWVDGKKTLNRLLEVGEQETLEAGRDLVVTAGDAGAVLLTFNGAVTRTLGKSGKTASVRITHANLEKYVKP
jgi:cytoskeleton protein RodZ